MSDRRELYEIWEVPSRSYHPISVQLVNYVANFRTREMAERYIAAVKAERKKLGLK
jgi:hypothetical protein